MPRHVALLRGVNVGGARKLPMAQLRALLESMGHEDVVTYIQSGNVVFTAKKAITATSLEAAIEKEFELDVPVMLRTPAELARILRENPFAKEPTSTLHFGFYESAPPAAVVKRLDPSAFAPEEFAI